MSVNKKILITGADGFIGNHLTEELIRQKYDFYDLVRYNSFNSWGLLDSAAKEKRKDRDVFPGDL